MRGKWNHLRLISFMLLILAFGGELATTQALLCFVPKAKNPVQLQGQKAISPCRHVWKQLPSKKRSFFPHSIRDNISSPNIQTLSSRISFCKRSGRILKCALLGLMVWLAIPRAATAGLTSSVEATSPIIASATAAATETSLPPLMMNLGSPVSPAVELRLTLRLVYAALMGAALGKERSLTKHSAGVRTMALVAMGASAFTVCSAFGFLQFPGRYDPSRMAANVASGVGFVGAGVITTSAHRDSMNVVHGLTTAATIWLSAGVGVACGVGLFRVATTAALTTITILRLGRRKPKNRDGTKKKANEESEERRSPESGQRNTISFSSHQTLGITNSSHDESSEEEPSDYFAEVHDTSVWDEHHEDDYDELLEDKIHPDKAQHVTYVESMSQDKREVQELKVSENTDPMSHIVEGAWRRNASNLPIEEMEFESLECYIKRPNGTYSRPQKKNKRNTP